MDTFAFEYLVDRGVTRICHFTKTVSLLHIFRSEDGILATKFLDEDIKRQNDLERLDNEIVYINCSIQYPNYWYWKKIKDKDPIFKKWVILFISPEIIKYRDLKFSPCNAATGYGRYISSDNKTLTKMFAPQLEVKGSWTRTERMLNCCPTDDQCEILVHKNIPLEFITGIAVPNDEVAQDIIAQFKTLGIDNYPLLYITPAIFDGSWSGAVRRGTIPAERKFLGGDSL